MTPMKSLLQDPPAASSSEDEEVESGEEEEDEEVESGEEEEEDEAGGDDEEGESESDEEEPTPKRPEPVVSKPESSSSSDEDEDEDEDSDEDDESESDEIPLKSKPSVAEEPKPKKTVSKPSSSTAAPAFAVVPVSQKRHAETDSKKKKKNTDEANGEKIDPKKLFARVWSDDDEVVILKGMMKWHEKGHDPFTDLGGFLDSIKESVHAAVKQDQLLNKMRRLKKKYQNNFKRGKGGLDPIFSKPHDLKCYELMKVIWGGEEVSSRKRSAPADNGNEETANGKKSMSSKPKTATPVSPKQKTVALSDISSKELPKEVQEGSASAYPLLAAAFGDMKNSPTVGESLFKEGLALLGDSKAKEMENKWRKLHQEEAEVYLKRVELVRELTATVLNAMKSSDA